MNDDGCARSRAQAYRGAGPLGALSVAVTERLPFSEESCIGFTLTMAQSTPEARDTVPDNVA